MGDADEVFRLRDEALTWRAVDRETIALDLASSTYLSVNEAGTALWEALAAGATSARLAEMLCDEFGISKDQAREDTELFLAECRQHNLLRSVG